MSSKILLNYKKAVFYPNFSTDTDLQITMALFPICHTTAKTSVLNFHEDLELTFFLREGADCIWGENIHSIQAEDVMVANAYVPHQLLVTKDGMGYFTFIIPNSFCKYNSIDVTTLHFQEHIHDQQLIRLFYETIDIFKTDAPWRNAALKAKVLEILVFLYQNYSTPQAAQPPMVDKSWKYIYAAIQYIKENISRKLTVAQIAEYAGASESHFMREFKRITGSTVTGYINTARCEYAESLLQSQKYKVKEAAALCGFENEEYFTKVFKKHTGRTPSEYIKATQTEG